MPITSLSWAKTILRDMVHMLPPLCNFSWSCSLTGKESKSNVFLLRIWIAHSGLPIFMSFILSLMTPHLNWQLSAPLLNIFPESSNKVLFMSRSHLSEKAMAPHSSTLAWKTPWMEEPGRLQTMGSLRVRHDWATSLSLFPFMHWRRKWQPTPVFLPGESQGLGSLVGLRLWGHTESDTTEVT